MAPGVEDGAVTAKRLRAITDELSEHFFEREDVVRTLLVAMLARQHSLILGPPGTAKSELARELTGRDQGLVGCSSVKPRLSGSRRAGAARPCST
ncbi:hypothetical protein ABZ054_05090, partial [Streptomyces sp. NPDC006324]